MAGGSVRGGRNGAMPRQVCLDPQSQRIDTGGFRSPGGRDGVGGGGFNRRPQVFADHGIDLPKLVVQLGTADAQRHGLSDGGLFLPERLAFTRVAAPADQAGTLVGAEDDDGQRSQLAVDAVQALQGLAECHYSRRFRKNTPRFSQNTESNTMTGMSGTDLMEPAVTSRIENRRSPTVDHREFSVMRNPPDGPQRPATRQETNP